MMLYNCKIVLKVLSENLRIPSTPLSSNKAIPGVTFRNIQNSQVAFNISAGKQFQHLFSGWVPFWGLRTYFGMCGSVITPSVHSPSLELFSFKCLEIKANTKL